MPELHEGAVVDGRYELMGRIGSGGMADVWLARDPHLQRLVALKVLQHRFAQDQGFIERFRREAEAAAALQHPNIVAVFDRGDVDGTYYIAMQLLEGRSLKELIDRGLDTAQAVGLVRQVLEAAGFAHRRGVVHRDLKPQNVIVDDDGKATVTDFGIARAGTSDITQAGEVMGTPQYLSPEGAQGLEVTPASDLYSIGVMLYEALTGRVPFEGESAVAVAMKQVAHAPLRPSSINPAVSPALDAVVVRALEKDPGRRFQSAGAFIAALDAALRDPGGGGSGTVAFAPLPPVVAPPQEAGAEGAREGHSRIRRWLPWVLAAVLAGALAGFALTRDTTTAVPGVTGERLSDAVALLAQDGFKVGDVKRVQRSSPRDTVLEQDPLASPPAGQASLDCSFLSFFCSKPSVSLTVSAGPGRARVPATAGSSQQDAVAALEAAGFEAKLKRVSSEDVAAGLVVYSRPSAGTLATRGSLVTLAVSGGPKLATVPVLVGTQRALAVQQIRARGLVPEVSEEPGSTAAGEVTSQSPSAGSKLPRGSTVAIVVSQGERKATVPNLIGRERAAAVQALRGLGLRPSVQEAETEVEAQVGRVIDQFPPPGSEVEPGASVTVMVGKAAAEPAPGPSAETGTAEEGAP